jgi:hypothetical protein
MEEHRIQEPYYGDIMEEHRIQEPYYGDIMEELRIQEPYYGDIMEELRIQEPYYGDIMEEHRIQAEIEDRRRIQHEWEAYHAAERYHKEVKESHARRIDIYTHYCRQQAHLNVENIVSEKKPRRHYRYRRDRKKNNKKKTNVVV